MGSRMSGVKFLPCRKQAVWLVVLDVSVGCMPVSVVVEAGQGRWMPVLVAETQVFDSRGLARLGMQLKQSLNALSRPESFPGQTPLVVLGPTRAPSVSARPVPC